MCEKIQAMDESSEVAVEGTALPEMRRDDEFFCQLVDSIPPRYYFDQDTAKEIRDRIQQETDDVVSEYWKRQEFPLGVAEAEAFDVRVSMFN